MVFARYTTFRGNVEDSIFFIAILSSRRICTVPGLRPFPLSGWTAIQEVATNSNFEFFSPAKKYFLAGGVDLDDKSPCTIPYTEYPELLARLDQGRRIVTHDTPILYLQSSIRDARHNPQTIKSIVD